MPTKLAERPHHAPVPVIPGYADTRQFTAPAPVKPGQQEATAPIPQEDYKARHRRQGIARKVANFVMNGGRRHTGKHAATRSTNLAKSHAAPGRAAVQPQTQSPERRSATARTPHLRYQRGIGEGTEPQEIVSAGTHQPLLTREHVNQQLGFEAFGDLQMVLHLPDVKEPLYCFKSTQDLGKGKMQVDYRLATPQQLEQMRSSANTPAWDEVYEGMMHLNRINNGETLTASGGTSVIIGRDYWLPGRPGKDHAADPVQTVPSGMEKAAPKWLQLRIDDTNNLMVQNLTTPYDYRMDLDTQRGQAAAIVEINPELIPPADFTNAPIYSFRDDIRYLHGPQHSQ